MTDHEKYMMRAVRCAQKAEALGEVPVGAVIVRDGKVIASGYNRRECDRDALAHAEMTAIRRACKKLGGWRLIGCDLYVTLEPCPMCAGAIINARIEHVFIGARDPKAGSFGSVVDLSVEPYNHKPEIEFGVLGDVCSALLSDFFKKLRLKKK